MCFIIAKTLITSNLAAISLLLKLIFLWDLALTLKIHKETRSNSLKDMTLTVALAENRLKLLLLQLSQKIEKNIALGAVFNLPCVILHRRVQDVKKMCETFSW